MKTIANFILIITIVLISLIPLIKSQPQSAPFSTCQSGYELAPDERRLKVNKVLTQIDKSTESTGDFDADSNILRTLIFGEIQEPLYARNSSTDRLATLLVHSRALSFELYDKPLSLCDHVLPSNATSSDPSCPANEGEIAIGVATPLPPKASHNQHPYALTTLVNTFRLLDASNPALEIACIDVPYTPYYPNGWFYSLIFWIPVSLAIAYLILISVARFGSAYRKSKLTKMIRVWAGRQRLETAVIGGISGQMFSTTPGLLRFVTPSVGNIILHTQWCATLGMIAVNWPSFAYPFFNQVVWSSLLYNVSLTTHNHVDPLASKDITLPDPFNNLIYSNASSPVYMNQQRINNLLDDGDVNHNPGLDSLSQLIGLHKQDLFGCCVALALAIAACLIVLSLLLWTLDSLIMIAYKKHSNKNRDNNDKKLNKRFSATNASLTTSSLNQPSTSRNRSEDELVSPGTSNESRLKKNKNNRFGWRRAIWEMRLGGASGGFHWNILQGNLVRLLMLFHLPITALSVYQLSLANSVATKASVALAVLVIVFISLAFPTYVLVRISRTPTLKLYDATRTILSLGPLYNLFRPGSQLFWGIYFISNIIEGIMIGAVQVSGTAQSIVILIVELCGLLMMTIWSPWGYGAQMGLLTFLNSVGRVITSALLIVLCPAVNINYVAAGWVTYVIFVIQGIVFAVGMIIFLSKLLEGLLRFFARLPFIEDAPTRESGLMGAISSIGRRNKKLNNREGASAVSNTTSTQAILERQSFSERGIGMNDRRRKGLKNESSDYSFSTAISPPQERDDEYIMSAWRPTNAFDDSSDDTHGNYLQRVIDDDDESTESQSDEIEVDNVNNISNNNNNNNNNNNKVNVDRSSTPLVPPSLPNTSFVTTNETLHSHPHQNNNNNNDHNDLHSLYSQSNFDNTEENTNDITNTTTNNDNNNARGRTRSFSAVVEVFGDQNPNPNEQSPINDDSIGKAK